MANSVSISGVDSGFSVGMRVLLPQGPILGDASQKISKSQYVENFWLPRIEVGQTLCFLPTMDGHMTIVCFSEWN